MSRPRLKKNKSLPPNLYFHELRNMYRYRRPDTGKFTYIGKDRMKAIAAAKKLNSLLMEGEDLVAKVMCESKTLSQYIDDQFVPVVLPERDIKAGTLTVYVQQLRHVKKVLGNHAIHNISVKMIAEFLSSQNSARQSNKYRGVLMLLFTHAKADGLIDVNPVESTLKRREVKQRQRLKLNEFNAIYKKAGTDGLLWLQDAMEIGMLTLQRESDILGMQFSDIIEETHGAKQVNILRVIQEKTEKYGESAHIKIVISSKLAAVIARCKQRCKNDGILSPFLISRMPKKIYKSKEKAHHTQVLTSYFCESFAKVRDATGLFDHLKPRQRPTFHEIRSLAIKLHEDNGNDAQALAGHTTRKMTDYYKKGHEVNWTYADSA